MAELLQPSRPLPRVLGLRLLHVRHYVNGKESAVVSSFGFMTNCPKPHKWKKGAAIY